MAIDNPFKVSTTDQILLYEPTERGILWIIANNKKAFGIETINDLIKHPEMLTPNASNNSNKNLVKALPIYIKLHQRGFIKQCRNKPEIKITWTGQFYRFYTHPALTFWGVLISILIGISTLIVSIIVLLRTETHILPKGTTKQVQEPTHDSLPHHQKKDTSFFPN